MLFEHGIKSNAGILLVAVVVITGMVIVGGSKKGQS